MIGYIRNRRIPYAISLLIILAGVISLFILVFGFLGPPMGLNLFLSATRFHKPLPYLYREALPFLGIMTVGVLFVTYVPSVTLWLLHALGKG